MAFEQITTRQVLRNYAALMESGQTDADLNPRARRLAVVLLNLVNNHAVTEYPYPPTVDNRNTLCRRLGDLIWDARALIYAVSPSDATTAAIDTATERVSEIIRNF